MGLFLAFGGVTAQAEPARILILGDSLSAEYGLPRGQGWVALLEQRLATGPLPTTVINASISGETTSGGAARLPELLRRHRPNIVVIELGGNDALRGLPLDSTRSHLLGMVNASLAAKAKVLLIGMQVPPNYGARYTQDFAKVFQQVATQEKVALVPFFLAGLADAPDARQWFQPDGIHPTVQAQARMLDNVWPTLRQLLQRVTPEQTQPAKARVSWQATRVATVRLS